MPTAIKSFPKILPGVELHTKSRFPAIVHTKKRQRYVDVYCDPDEMAIDNALYIASSRGHIISFFGIVENGESATYSANLKDTIYSNRYYASSTVVGHRRWRPHSPIKYARFKIGRLKDTLFLNKKRLLDITPGSSQYFDVAHIATITTSRMRITMRFDAIYRGGDGWRKVHPEFHVDFLGSRDFNSYLEDFWT